MKKDNIGDRMKNYEAVSKARLIRRTPVAIRIDGKAFHTFTRGFEKPFDRVLVKTMQETTLKLCKNIQGCVFGYTQSDEITLILVDYQKLNSQAWFDNEVQKICSISASMATLYFNKIFREIVEQNYISKEIEYERYVVYKNKFGKAMFDSRAFNIPREEVTNLVLWRQLDATRNSIEMVGRANFSHSELFKKNCNMIQDMLFQKKGVNWNNLPVIYKRGTSVIKENSQWIIDEKMPVLKGKERDYIDKLIFI